MSGVIGWRLASVALLAAALAAAMASPTGAATTQNDTAGPKPA